METVAEMLDTWAGATPAAAAITQAGLPTTYAELDAASRRVAAALAADGIGHGDRVAFIARNRVEHFEVLFACSRLGAVFVPLNWRLHRDEISQILDRSGAGLVVVAGDLAVDLGDALTDRAVVLLDGAEDAPRGYGRWSRQHPPVRGEAVARPHDLALLMYTSGTTGLPKGVMLTHANLCGAAEVAADWGFGPDAVALVCMPLFHMSGTSWGLVALRRGSRLVLLAEAEPAGILGAIEESGVTHALLVPAVIAMLLSHPACASTSFASLRLLVYGGAPISVELLAAGLSVLGCSFLQLYGLTESTGLATLLGPEDHVPDGPRSTLLRSVGRPSPAVELRVVDPDTGQLCPPGAVGELWLRGANITVGYWQDAEATAEALTDGWLRTGDAGYLDDEGYVYLHDRVKDMIVSGGENVYPAEAERVLRQHPEVADLAVVGVPSDRWGETPKAVVVLRAGAGTSEGELLEFVRDRLAHYKCPTSVDLVEELPRNATGKVLKRALREPYWAGHDRRVH